MPQQDQSTTGQIPNEDTIRQFMSLDEDHQTRSLAKMKDGDKHWLLLGIRALKSADAQNKPQPQKEDEGILAGFTHAATSTVKGLHDLFVPEGEPGGARDVGRQTLETYKQGGRQAKEQVTSGIEAIRRGSPIEGGLQTLRGVGTGLSLLDPLATGSVVSANQAADEGRYGEALGQGAFDLLTLWGGKRIGSEPTETTRLNKVASATGADVKNLERVMPDLAEAAKAKGRPKTIGDLKEIIDQGSLEKEAEFQRDFAAVKNRRVYTPLIRNQLDRILRENPQWTKTEAGRARIAAINKVKGEYDVTGWTLEDFNKERSSLRKDIRNLKNMSPSDQRAALARDTEMEAKSIVANVMSETVNDHLTHANGKPRFYYDILRQKQEAFIDLQDHMADQVDKLRNKQAAKAGQGLRERVKPHAYMSAGGPRVHVPMGEAVPEDVGELADSKVKQAFQRGGPNRWAKVGKGAVLSLPLSHLTTAGEEVRKSRSAPEPPPQME
jgi:hypothetical protein